MTTFSIEWDNLFWDGKEFGDKETQFDCWEFVNEHLAKAKTMIVYLLSSIDMDDKHDTIKEEIETIKLIEFDCY